MLIPAFPTMLYTWEWTESPAQPIIKLVNDSFTSRGIFVTLLAMLVPVVISKNRLNCGGHIGADT